MVYTPGETRQSKVRVLLTVAFAKGGSGSITAAVFPVDALSAIGTTRPSSKSDFIEHIQCGKAAIAAGQCKQEEHGLFLLDHTQPAASQVTQWRVNPGKEMTLSAPITKSGEYCVFFSALSADTGSFGAHGFPTATVNATYNARFVFDSSFHGELPAAEYPKLNFYFVLMLVYAATACTWTVLCFKHWGELVTLQHMTSYMMGFLVVDALFQWLIYRYCNDHALSLQNLRALDGGKGVTVAARTIIVVATILDATRNSMSFFFLLVVSMGYGVVRPTIGPVINRVVALTVAHFVFGVLYAVGILLYIMDVGAIWPVLSILPLSLTLSIFMVWILVSLKTTMAYLEEKRQTFKHNMFKKLFRILTSTAFAIVRCS